MLKHIQNKKKDESLYSLYITAAAAYISRYRNPSPFRQDKDSNVKLSFLIKWYDKERNNLIVAGNH